MKKCFVFVFSLLLCVFLFSGSYWQEEVVINIGFKGESIVWSDSKFLNPKTVDYQFQIQQKGLNKNHKDRAELIEKIVSMGFSYENACGYVFPNLNQMVDDFVQMIDEKPLDATLKFTPNNKEKFVYTNEREGRFVDKGKLYQEICQNLGQTNDIYIAITPEIIKPKITKKDLISQTKLISFFETDYSKSSDSRKQNIQTALKAFNGPVLEPNREYSFNKITGKRTKEKGYKEANIIVNNEYVEGFGGGVCQVSTTLYNALLLADVSVLESHPHSLESSYVMIGFDAMVNFDSSDLRFKNTSTYPLYVRTYYNNEKIGVEIYSKPLPYKIERKSKILSEKMLDDVVVEDQTMMIGEKRYQTLPKLGKKVKTYLEYYKNGKVIKTKPVRTSTYKPVQGVMLVGTKKDFNSENNQTFSQFQTI